jgi:hypothetical protein
MSLLTAFLSAGLLAGLAYGHHHITASRRHLQLLDAIKRTKEADDERRKGLHSE